eukprot:m.213114 g.213114  ORF g.213114 m.213114 type:complete len:321 (-) comp16952_c0_seq18:2915-3877(-)
MLLGRHEQDLARQALSRLAKHPAIHVLGSSSASRVAIISFMVFHSASGLYLHHNFVCALLNDLFGIQARGGCACAGPYAQRLMGMTQHLAHRIEELLVEDSRLDRDHLRRKEEHGACEMLRPGFVRINLPWFMDEETIDFVLEAVEFVATHGWRLLPFYNLHLDTGEWRHQQHTLHKDRKWLSSLSFSKLASGATSLPRKGEFEAGADRATMLADANMALTQLSKLAVPEIANISLMSSEAETVRWFLYPQEAAWHNAYPDTSTIMRRSPFIVVSRQDGATTQVRWLRGTVFDLNGYLLVGSKKKKKLANYFTKQYSLHW